MEKENTNGGSAYVTVDGHFKPVHVSMKGTGEKGFLEFIDRKIIVVKDAVKEVGNYKAIVKLHKEVSVEIPFEVVAEEA